MGQQVSQFKRQPNPLIVLIGSYELEFVWKIRKLAVSEPIASGRAECYGPGMWTTLSYDRLARIIAPVPLRSRAPFVFNVRRNLSGLSHVPSC